MSAEQRFKEQFVVTFLASWCAHHYDDYCQRELHDELEHPPIEDAVELANAAWTHGKDLGVLR